VYEGSVTVSSEEEDEEEAEDEPLEDLHKLSKPTLVARLLDSQAEVLVLKARLAGLEA